MHFLLSALLSLSGLLPASQVQGDAAPKTPPAGTAQAPESRQPAPAETPTVQDPGFEHQFGAVGSPGSMRVKFDPRGAGIVWLLLTDHLRAGVEAGKDMAARDPGDFLLLVWGGGDYSLRLRGGEGSGLPPIQELDWTHEERDGAVHFARDLGNGLVLHKTFRHMPEKRALRLELELENKAAAADGGVLPLALIGPAIHNPTEASLFGNPALAIAVAQSTHAHVTAKVNEQKQLLAGADLAMAGSTNRFFAGFVFPVDDAAQRAVTQVLARSLPALDAASAAQPRAEVDLQLPRPAVGARSAATFAVYFGPKSYRVFDEIGERERFGPIMTVDLEPPCCISVPGGRQMATLLVWLLGVFHGLVGNWGLAIICLTVLVRGCLAPLNFRMQKSMRAYGAKMAKLKPKMDRMKTEYADDPKAYQQAMIQFQREHKVFPPLGGCLPIFLTMPIYLGLFTALRTAYDLRQQPFAGWIHDLSQPDGLFHLGWFSWLQDFNLLPLCWMAMFIRIQLKMPLPTDPQQRQVQVIMRYMPILFGVMLYNYASGLMVYMVTSMIWTMVESAITRKILGPIDPNVQAMAPTPVM